MLGQDTAIDGVQGVRTREAESEHAEVPLQTCVYGKRPSSRVHAGHVLRVVNLLERELVTIVPVTVVEVLPDQSVRLHGEVLVYLGHVHIVNEVDEAFRARRSEITAGFLLQRFLQHALQHLRCGVEVEGDIGHHVIFSEPGQLVVDQHGLSETGISHQHDGSATFHQQVHEIFHSSCLGCVNQSGLEKNKGTS